MTDDELQALEALCEKATPGPWEHLLWQQGVRRPEWRGTLMYWAWRVIERKTARLRSFASQGWAPKSYTAQELGDGPVLDDALRGGA
jgi:hypothetical protein